MQGVGEQRKAGGRAGKGERCAVEVAVEDQLHRAGGGGSGGRDGGGDGDGGSLHGGGGVMAMVVVLGRVAER